ncbi:MAG: SDR family oxidoreductase [Planctomycetales bacterium]|nr:SDR family oxidoreductase [Planctomycetales bacterium]
MPHPAFQYEAAENPLRLFRFAHEPLNLLAIYNPQASDYQMPIAVITGSSSGIGQATALAMAQRGYDLLLHARGNLLGLQATARQIGDEYSGTKVRCITADFSCNRARRDFVQAAFAWQGSVAAWVNNAGADVLTGASAALPFLDRLERLWAIDVAATADLSRRAAVRMADRPVANMSITNMGWDQAQMGMEGEPGQLFCTVKAAVEAFSRALAMSVGPNIRVNCVAPGWIRTAWGQASTSEYWTKRAVAESLSDRWGTPEDVAQCISWLTSEQASFVSGQAISVNGGRRYFPANESE